MKMELLQTRFDLEKQKRELLSFEEKMNKNKSTLFFLLEQVYKDQKKKEKDRGAVNIFTF